MNKMKSVIHLAASTIFISHIDPGAQFAELADSIAFLNRIRYNHSRCLKTLNSYMTMSREYGADETCIMMQAQ
jgi:hypothetical protein